MYEYEYQPPLLQAARGGAEAFFLPQHGGLEGWKDCVSALGLFFLFSTGIGDVEGRARLWDGFGWV